MRGYHHRIAAVFLNHSDARQVRLDDTLLREYVGGRGVGALSSLNRIAASSPSIRTVSFVC